MRRGSISASASFSSTAWRRLDTKEERARASRRVRGNALDEEIGRGVKEDAPLVVTVGCASSSIIRSRRTLELSVKRRRKKMRRELTYFLSSLILTLRSPDRCSSMVVSLCF